MLFVFCRQDKQLNNSPLKPDYLLSINTLNEEKLHIFAIEVKGPLRNKNDNDFIKIGYIMKGMVNNLLDRGIKNETVFGLLVAGKNIKGLLTCFRLSTKYYFFFRHRQTFTPTK